MTRAPLRWLLLGSVLGAIVLAFGGFALYLDGAERENRLTDIDSELVRAARNGPERGANDAPPPPAPAQPDETVATASTVAATPATPATSATEGAGAATAPVQGPGPAAQPPPGTPRGQGEGQTVERPDREVAANDTETAATEAEALAIEPPVQLLLNTDLTLSASIGAPNPFDDERLVEIGSTFGISTIEDLRYRVRVTEMRDQRIAVTALSLDDFDDAVGRFRTALLLGGAVLLGLVAAVLWILTGFLARPVTRMASTARRIADGELDTPIDATFGSRETSDLAVDLDRMVTRLRAALNDATTSRDDMERLLADMAHEVRTPLTALKGYSDLYLQGMLATDADVDRAMSRIGSESERLAELANAMLQLASEGVDRGDVEEFDLVTIADDVAGDLSAAYPGRIINVVADSPHVVVGSPHRMQQALLNLTSNACNHSPEGQPVSIEVASDELGVVARVVDHGPGIAPDDRDRVFLPFFRTDAARERSGHGGAGLGLALTRRIVERHGGDVTVHATPGGGATFVVRLPAVVRSG